MTRSLLKSLTVGHSMKNHLSLILLTLYFFCVNAHAQTRCPMGAQAGSMQCLPDDPGGGGQNSAPRPTGEWIKTWGAIATSRALGEAGTSANKLSEDDARAAAIYQCALGGATDCEVHLTYRNQCAAFATSSTDTYFASAESEKRAIKSARSNCEKDSDSECKVMYSECSDPIFHKY
ncbi:DUF4189 domain-containing protein [Pseudomonas cichorii]|uniref:DUF4189 domain-containing protein n=1 Tax=Pseudomonas cichorii TaxID=36746 RepID=UPI001910FA59|nr:DUF4189 domain-containing protein [Pseudomonas cichorii]